MAGWVYVLENESMPGLVKVGYTKNSPKSRAGQLYQTGLPTPFTVYYAGLYENPRATEGLAHKALKHCRVSRGREFFKCQPSEAVAAIELRGKPVSTKRDITKAEWAGFYKEKKAIEARCEADIEAINKKRNHLNEIADNEALEARSNEKEINREINFSHFGLWFIPSILMCDSFENEGVAFFIIWLLCSLTTSYFQKVSDKKSDKYKNLVSNRLEKVQAIKEKNYQSFRTEIDAKKDNAKRQIKGLRDALGK